jgi:hypothetical protein
MDHIKVARWTYYTGNFIDKINSILFSLWGIFKNRHLSNATGRIRDESLMNLGGRGKSFSAPSPHRKRAQMF